MKVQVTDGIRACPPLDFTIEALPPAPGEFSSVVDTLQDIVQAIAGDLELTTQDLLSGDDELPSYAFPLVAAQALLDDPSNPDSLRAMSQGTAPFLGDDPDNGLLDAIVSRLALRQVLDEDLGDGLDPSARSSQGLATPCEGSAIASSAASLDFCMKLSREAERKLKSSEDGPAAQKVKEDIEIAKVTLAAVTGTGPLIWGVEKRVK